MLVAKHNFIPLWQGMITVKGQVDREKGDFYTLTVVADDGGPKIDSTVVSSFCPLSNHPLHRMTSGHLPLPLAWDSNVLIVLSAPATGVWKPQFGGNPAFA